jgi:hypothetical protein
MAVGIDDSRYNEFACEVKDVSAGCGWILDDGPMSRMRPFSIRIATSFCGAAPVPSMTVA